MRKQPQRGAVLVSTKLTPSDREKFSKLSESFGMTNYELAQALILSLLRYFDTDSIITAEHNTMLNAFYNDNFFKTQSFYPTLMKDTKSLAVSSAIVFMSKTSYQGKKKSPRPQALLVRKDGEHITESYNFDSMLELFLLSAAPEVLTALQVTKETTGDISLLHTLHSLVLDRATQPEDTMRQEIEEMFSDIRISTGEQINYDDIHYKRGHNSAAANSCFTTPKRRRVLADLGN